MTASPSASIPRDTKDRILDSAEAAFSEHGFDGTSLRALTSRAGVNLAAVHYHFGSKEALLIAVLDRRLAPINEQRLQALDHLEAGSSPPRLEELLRAFLEPAFRGFGALGEAGVRFLQLAGRMHSEANPAARRIFLQRFRDVIARYVPAFRRALPDVDDAALHWKLHFLVGGMAHVLAWSPHRDCQEILGSRTFDPEEAREALVAFCAAGMRAPAVRAR